jgi:hypothetical protein
MIQNQLKLKILKVIMNLLMMIKVRKHLNILIKKVNF